MHACDVSINRSNGLLGTQIDNNHDHSDDEQPNSRIRVNRRICTCTIWAADGKAFPTRIPGVPAVLAPIERPFRSSHLSQSRKMTAASHDGAPGIGNSIPKWFKLQLTYERNQTRIIRRGRRLTATAHRVRHAPPERASRAPALFAPLLCGFCRSKARPESPALPRATGRPILSRLPP